jgi:hypothetical protein
MLRRLQTISVVFAWLFATGSHWDLVQTFAWGRMIATYSQTMSVGEAVKLTFKPTTLCNLCEMVSAAQKQQTQEERSGPGVKSDAKILLVFQSSAKFVLTRPAADRWFEKNVRVPTAERLAPPLPPPRSVAA